MFIAFITNSFIKKILFLILIIFLTIPSWSQTTNKTTTKATTNQATKQSTTNQATKQNTTNTTTKQAPVKQSTTNQTTKQNTNNQTKTNQTVKQNTTNQNTKQNTTNQTTKQPTTNQTTKQVQVKQSSTNQTVKQTTTNQSVKQSTTNQPKNQTITNSENQSTTIQTQQEPQKVEERVDTIVLVSGKKLLGKVNGVLTSKVTYFPTGKTKIEELARKQVQLIRYSTGRVEKFNKPAYEMVAEGDFKTIILTDKPEEVSGLFELGKVNAQSSKSSRDAKTAEASANIRLQKKAANMGAYIVLIKKRESKGGYGEVPTHYVEGVAYGLEAPKSQPK